MKLNQIMQKQVHVNQLVVSGPCTKIQNQLLFHQLLKKVNTLVLKTIFKPITISSPVDTSNGCKYIQNPPKPAIALPHPFKQLQLLEDHGLDLIRFII